VSDDDPGSSAEGQRPRAASARSRWRRFLAIGIVLLLLGFAGWLGARAVQAMFKTKGNLARIAGVPLQVTIAQVTAQEIQEVIGGTALGEGFERLSIISVVSEGRILTVKTDLGSLVNPGDVMLEFDLNVFRQVLERARLAVAAARADLKKLEAERETRLAELKGAAASAVTRLASARATEDFTHKTYDRTKVLFDQKVVALAELEQIQVKWDDAKSAVAVSTQDLLRAEAALKNEALVIQALLEAARARLGLALQDSARAERDVKSTKVLAPQTGVVSERKVNPGEWVKGAQLLFAVDRIEPIYAVAQIEQEKSAYVSVGQAAETVFDSFPTTIQRGTVAKIDPSIDPARRTFKAYVLLENPSLKLRPGMAAFTRLKNTRRVTLVPRLAVINPTGAPSIDATVFVVDDSIARTRKVKLGKPEGLGLVEVLDGIKDGEWVVIHGNKELNPGDRVDARKFVEATNARKGKEAGSR